MVDKIIRLLINAGLKKDHCVELAKKINNLYEELEREKQRERGRKGGKAKVLKGTRKIKVEDPERFKRIIAARSKSKS